ncbi:facilitated trehalose transporter Tret1-like [Hyposmocoma kahamanoa]|uniref:facilitated trehalose transporter Tret1-like n=1 Tax=Hyposmocoma kahamanoa TaxID=1477025 RepID=UPI000E6D94CB|nr:facilitated trehalose transporter Tret1-like [Hyposmocoma kahamanoa]
MTYTNLFVLLQTWANTVQHIHMRLTSIPRRCYRNIADDAAFLSCSSNPSVASAQLQRQLDATSAWLKKHITFALRRSDCSPVKLGVDSLPKTSCAKYLGFYLDRRLTWKCFITAGVSLNIVGHGCVIGFSAVLIPSLRRPESHIHATPAEESWIASVIGFALIMGNITITPLMDTLGRKKCHLLTIIPNMIGWIMLPLVNNVAGLIIARLLQGLAMGMIGPLGSIIIGEMTDPKNRGAFLTCVSLSLTTGVLTSHTLGSYFSWQCTAMICSFVTFTSLILVIYSPESPSWLISKERFEEGRIVFLRLRGETVQQEEELEHMISAKKMVRTSSVEGVNLSFGRKFRRFCSYLRDASRKPEFYKPITVMFLTYTMFQFAGINVISSYAMDIITQVVGPEANAKFWMVALDIERFICNVLAIFLVRTMKRRFLLFSTGGLCIFCYLGKAYYVFAKQNNTLLFDGQWIPITLIALYMFSLTVGISAITFAIPGEIFPLQYRGLGGGLSILGLSLNFFIAVKCFPVLNGSIGLPLTYCLYAGIVLLCLTVIWFMLPETKDRTLQEIEDIFKGIPPRNRRSAQTGDDHTNAAPLVK